MFGKRKKSWRGQEIYEQLLQNIDPSWPHTEIHPALRRCAAREAREQARQEAIQKEEVRQARAREREAEQQRQLQVAARQHLQEVTRGLRHDGVEPDEALMQRLAHLAIGEYMRCHSRWEYDPAQAREVFETEYKKALESRTFFHPFTGNIETW